jgi:hypothetical protein
VIPINWYSTFLPSQRSYFEPELYDIGLSACRATAMTSFAVPFNSSAIGCSVDAFCFVAVVYSLFTGLPFPGDPPALPILSLRRFATSSTNAGPRAVGPSSFEALVSAFLGGRFLPSLSAAMQLLQQALARDGRYPLGKAESRQSRASSRARSCTAAGSHTPTQARETCSTEKLEQWIG